MNPSHLIGRMLRPLYQRLSNSILRGVLRLIDNNAGIQSMQVSCRKGQLFSDVERFGEFGFMSVPPNDGQAEAIVVFIGASADHPVIVGVEHRPTSKPSGMTPGSSALYSTEPGTFVKVLADGSVELAAPAGVSITGDVELTGELTVTGDATIGGVSIAALVATYNAHTHISASPGNPTATPLPQIT
jgi:phage gp45-like